jgi:hypothetical protein
MLQKRDTVPPFYHRAVIVYEAQRFNCATGNSSSRTCLFVFLSIHTDIVLRSEQNVTVGFANSSTKLHVHCWHTAAVPVEMVY